MIAQLVERFIVETINGNPSVDISTPDRKEMFYPSRQKTSPTVDGQHEVLHNFLTINNSFLGISNFLPSRSILFIHGGIYQQMCTEMYCVTLDCINK